MPMHTDDIPLILLACLCGAVVFYFLVPWHPKAKPDPSEEYRKESFPIARVVPRRRRGR